MATDMIVRKVSGGGDRFVRDRRARVSAGEAGASDDMGVDVVHRGHEEVAAYSGASPELESSDTSEDGNSWMHGFETGDMVWGKVKSHPWWPGHIFHEAMASPSVRRSKREGHVLVAFFGDSSYGWFEPAELLPFDPHFEEKSKQTTSRNFLKAVEEAVDEVSRRRALGLSCLCRSPHSFRPASIPGHYAVDVIGYESGVIFSARQIKRARESFVPRDVVSFMRKLAAAPHGIDHVSLETTKMMATLLSIRKVLYEEFDETYAQAFGVEPVRPARNELGVVELPAKMAPRAAPLTGPLVIAETLGNKKGGLASVRSATKAAKDQAKKNKYLFKRRDDAPATSPPPPSAGGVIVSHGPLDEADQPTALSPPASATAIQHVPDSGGYLLQKRRPRAGDSGEGALVSHSRADDVKLVGDTVPGSDGSKSAGKLVSEPLDAKPASILDGQATAGAVPEVVRPRKPSRDATVSGIVVGVEPKKKNKKRLLQEEEPDTAEPILLKKKRKKQKDIDSLTGLPEPAQETRKSPEVAAPLQIKESVAVAETSPPTASDVRYRFSSVTLPKLDFNPEELDFKQLVPDLKALALDPFHGSDRNVSQSVRNAFLLFRSLVYRKSLPLRASEGKSDAAGGQQEDQPRSRPEAGAAVTAVPPAAPAQQRAVAGATIGTASVSAIGEDREQKPPKLPSDPSTRPPKAASEASLARPDDPTKAGRKRPLSDRQEERSARKEKKLKQVKELVASQKKAALKAQDGKQPGGSAVSLAATRKLVKTKEESKETGTSPPATAAKKLAVDLPLGARKPQDAAIPAPAPAPKVPSPTYLVMKFPPRTTLPSIASLKARFGRFGPLDVDACRVFWKTYTCKVLFKFKADAQVAIAHVKNNNIFGQINVNYFLRELEVAQPADAPEPEKRGPVAPEAAVVPPPRSDVATVQFRPGRGGESAAAPPPLSTPPPPALKKPQQPLLSQPVQLKSILKKPSMDDSSPIGANGAKETPRVKFKIDGDASSNNIRRDSPSGYYGAGGIGNGGGVNGTPMTGSDVESFNSKISRLLAPAQTPPPRPPVVPVPPPPRPPVVPVPRPPEAYYRAPPISLPLTVTTARLVVAQDRGPSPFGKFQPPRPYPVGRDGAGPSGFGGGAAAARNVDISGEMLGLLRRCKDIVSNIQSLGCSAYRPL